jgi:integrase
MYFLTKVRLLLVNIITTFLSGKKTATFLMLLRDTGARAGEAWNLQWKSIDSNNRTVDIIPENGSRPRKLTNSNVIYQNSGSAQQ